MYEEGRIKEIRDYCETDVLNTYLVYLRYMLHRADLTKEAYDNAVTDTVTMIEAESSARPHLGEFLEAWRAQCGGQFTLA